MMIDKKVVNFTSAVDMDTPHQIKKHLSPNSTSQYFNVSFHSCIFFASNFAIYVCVYAFIFYSNIIFSIFFAILFSQCVPTSLLTFHLLHVDFFQLFCNINLLLLFLVLIFSLLQPSSIISNVNNF